MKTVYICSSLRQENSDKVTEILKKLPPHIALRPTNCYPENKLGHVEADVAMLRYCDEVWVIGEYGRDCSWEIGYAMGLGKKVVVFQNSLNEKNISQDWMLHHGINNGLLVLINEPEWGNPV